MHYISATHYLERIHPETLVVNDPGAVRNAPEKIFPTLFDGLLPPTLMTRDREALEAFRAEFGDVILKPLFGNGGAGVFRLRREDENFGSLVDMFLADREPVIAQQYLPDVRAGDKRVILVEGEAVGALNRVPAEGDARANVHVGGTPEAIGLSDRDLEIAAIIGPKLKQMGIVFAGIDVIGNYLTEINVTSPTCIREIKAFGGPDIAALILDAIEARLARPRTGFASRFFDVNLLPFQCVATQLFAVVRFLCAPAWHASSPLNCSNSVTDQAFWKVSAGALSATPMDLKIFLLPGNVSTNTSPMATLTRLRPNMSASCNWQNCKSGLRIKIKRCLSALNLF